jgi:hypothetical protein
MRYRTPRSRWRTVAVSRLMAFLRRHYAAWNEAVCRAGFAKAGVPWPQDGESDG